MDTSEIVVCSKQDSVLIVTVLAEQLREFATVQGLRDGVLTAIESTKVKNVIIDLQRVKQIGSVAFLAFLAMRRQSGIDRIILTNLSEWVQELFGICKLIASRGSGKSAPFEQALNIEEALKMCE